LSQFLRATPDDAAHVRTFSLTVLSWHKTFHSSAKSVTSALDKLMHQWQFQGSPGLPDALRQSADQSGLSAGSARGRTGFTGRLLHQVTACPPTGGFPNYIAGPLASILGDTTQKPFGKFHDCIYLCDILN